MSSHRGFAIETCAHGWPENMPRECPLCQPEDTPSQFFPYNLMALTGAKLPPDIEPPTTDVEKDLLVFFKSHTLMTPDAAAHLVVLLKRLIEVTK